MAKERKRRPPSNKTQLSLPSSKADFTRLIAVVSIAAVVAAACNFIASSLNHPAPKPFCDSSDSLSAAAASPDYYCEPCPANGLCVDGKLECVHPYRKLGNSCVEDGDINKAAQIFSKWVQVHVCEAYAQFLCTGSGNYWVPGDELWNNLNEFKTRDSYGMDEVAYMFAKQKAMETIRSLLETRSDNRSVEEFKCPELLVDHYKPLSCVVRWWIVKHALLCMSAFGLLLGCLMVVSKAYRRYRLSVRAEQLYNEVCDILEEKPLVSRSISGESEPWVVASWLRDHLLSPIERKDPLLWRKVEELVQEDSRVDQYPKLVKGESKIVWEWQVEGSLSSSGKRKRSDRSAPELKEVMNLSSNLQRKMHEGCL